MAEHARGEPRLLDLGVAVHDAAGPAQVHFHRADRPDGNGPALGRRHHVPQLRDRGDGARRGRARPSGARRGLARQPAGEKRRDARSRAPDSRRLVYSCRFREQGRHLARGLRPLGRDRSAVRLRESLMTAIGFRILPIPRRPDKKLVAELARMVTPHLSDSMERLYAGGPQLRPMHNGAKLSGPAFTVRTPPRGNLLVHKAIDTAEPGDVIAVDAGGFNDHAIIGELMSARAEQRGVGGMVIWGAIRDSAELKAGSFPVYASGGTHRGPYKNGPGEINVPVTIGGIPVNPGDIIVGDADGLVAVPQEYAQEILASAKAKIGRA